MSEKLADLAAVERFTVRAKELIEQYEAGGLSGRLLLAYVLCALFPPALFLPIAAHRRQLAARREELVRRIAEAARECTKDATVPLGNIYFALRGIWPLNYWPMPIRVASALRPGVAEEDIVADSLPFSAPSQEDSNARPLIVGEEWRRRDDIPVFEVPVEVDVGHCSDNQCPCDNTAIPKGEGYLYISKELVQFRRDCRTLEELHKKLQTIQKGMTDFALITLDHGTIYPILMCKHAAKRRKLNLTISALDAATWWRTGKVPLRPTPQQ